MINVLTNIMTVLIFIIETAVCMERVILIRGGPRDFHTHNGPVQLLHTITPPLLKQVTHYLILICITNLYIYSLTDAILHTLFWWFLLLYIGQGFIGMELLCFQTHLKMGCIPTWASQLQMTLWSPMPKPWWPTLNKEPSGSRPTIFSGLGLV